MKTTLTSLLSLLVFFNMNSFAQNNIDLESLPSVNEMMVVRSNPSADTVIIGIHGGPTDELYEGDFQYFENISTMSVVEVRQYQHMNPSVLSNPALTLEDAIIINDTTVAVIRKVVNHFNDQNKTVVLIGHSFGAFLLPEYLDDYGIDDIHRIIPMSGRLNMNQEVVDAFATGYYAEFISGLTVSVESQQAPSSDWAAMKLQAGVGYNRYVDSLGTMDLSKLMYVYATHDVPVGRLLPEEIAMLEATNATILEIVNGGHSSAFQGSKMVQVLDFIRANPSTGINNFASTQAEVQFYPTIIDNNLTVDAYQQGEINIIDITGKLVHQEDCISGKNNITLEHLPTGQYIAQYRTIDNKWKINKVIKK